jgi:hypothetical protein
MNRRFTAQNENGADLPEYVYPDGGTGGSAGRPNQWTGGTACPTFAYDAIFGTGRSKVAGFMSRALTARHGNGGVLPEHVCSHGGR